MHWIDWAKDWQTLIAGVLAIIAAGVALWGAKVQAQAALRAAQLSIDSQTKAFDETEKRRRTAFGQAVMAGLDTLPDAARQTYQAVQNRYARGASVASVPVPVPRILTSSWEDLALLPPDIQNDLQRIVTLIEEVNLNVEAQARSIGSTYEQAVGDKLNALLKELDQLKHALRPSAGPSAIPPSQ
jgi:hypothetical protein